MRMHTCRLGDAVSKASGTARALGRGFEWRLPRELEVRARARVWQGGVEGEAQRLLAAQHCRPGRGGSPLRGGAPLTLIPWLRTFCRKVLVARYALSLSCRRTYLPPPLCRRLKSAGGQGFRRCLTAPQTQPRPRGGRRSARPRALARQQRSWGGRWRRALRASRATRSTPWATRRRLRSARRSGPRAAPPRPHRSWAGRCRPSPSTWMACRVRRSARLSRLPRLRALLRRSWAGQRRRRRQVPAAAASLTPRGRRPAALAKPSAKRRGRRAA